MGTFKKVCCITANIYCNNVHPHKHWNKNKNKFDYRKLKIIMDQKLKILRWRVWPGRTFLLLLFWNKFCESWILSLHQLVGCSLVFGTAKITVFYFSDHAVKIQRQRKKRKNYMDVYKNVETFFILFLTKLLSSLCY